MLTRVFICLSLTAVSVRDPAVTGLDGGSTKLGLGKVGTEESLESAVPLDTAEKGRTLADSGGLPQ